MLERICIGTTIAHLTLVQDLQRNSSAVTIDILYLLAPTLLDKLQDIKCSKEDVISLSVQFVSDTPPSITWKYEGKEATANDSLEIVTDKGVTALKIKSAQCSDSGAYSVRLENKHGSVESHCQLTVTSKSNSGFFLPFAAI